MSFKETVRNEAFDEENQGTIPYKVDHHKTHDLDEAIEVTGHGSYNFGLLLTLSLSLLSMGIDMFGFSVVVAGCNCDFQLDQKQKSILVSMPFLGAIVMSYFWGYVSDTRGRQKSLFIAMLGAFVTSTVSAFSPNWIFLAVFKFISTSFGTCAQSATYALLGESCKLEKRSTYMIIMTSILMLSPSAYFVSGYLILNLEFSYDLGFLVFLPWRLYVLILALPLGTSAFLLTYYCESPKFLLNAGREQEALESLNRMYKKNGGVDDYPVKKIVLNEEGNTRVKDVPLLKSLWQQTAPLFKPPLLWRSLQLFYIIGVIYSINNGYVMWYPFIADTFFSSVSVSNSTQSQGLCNMIASAQNSRLDSTNEVLACSSKIEIRTASSSIAHSLGFLFINLCLSKFASRRKIIIMGLMASSAVAGIGVNVAPSNIASFVMFIAFLLLGLCIGPTFSYFIDLYPTSYRGMVACLGTMVARGSALGGTNLVGAYFMDHCATTIYVSCIYVASGLLLSCLLPSDRPKKK